MVSEVKSIHPNPGGPTRAESPFTRKLKRIREDVTMAQSLASVTEGAQLTLILAQLDEMING